MGLFRGIISLLGGVVNFAGQWLGMKERAQDRKAGADEERLKQFEDLQDAEDRMDKVERPDLDGLVNGLRNKKF